MGEVGYVSGEPRVEAIFVSDAAGEPMRALVEAEAVAGRGIAEDRYGLGTGFYSYKVGPDRHLTLIAGEQLEELAAEGIRFAPGEHRRNIVTRGLDVDALVGRTFRIGAVELRGIRPCPPCVHLEAVTGRAGLMEAIGRHRGGMRTEVVTGGRLQVGDRIEVFEAV
jgi:MOSC domain-containing protein YiiM